MEQLYRIEELCTSGWELLDDKFVGLSRDQTKEALEQLIAEGYNPNAIRAVPDSQ